MKWSAQIICGIMLCGISIAGQIIAKSDSGNGGFTQMVLAFPAERPFHYEWLKTENTLIVHFPKSTPEELEAVNNYDEKLVRRVLVKDHGPEGTEVRLVLRDRNVRAVINSFKDPFRISIDLFDSNYAESRDPESGLPITTTHQGVDGQSRQGELLGNTNQDLPSQNSGRTGTTSTGTSKRRLLQARGT